MNKEFTRRKGIPMTTFDERESAFENKFAHDEEMKFKAEARRNKLLAHWAAELLGKTGAEVEAYATEVIKADFEEAGDDDVVEVDVNAKFGRVEFLVGEIGQFVL